MPDLKRSNALKKVTAKPITLDAIHYDWDNIEKHADEAQDEVCDFMGTDIAIDSDGYIEIDTPNGPVYASRGDYIIKGITGNFFPCKPDVFAKTYDTSTRTAPKDPDQELTEDEIAKLASGSSLCDCVEVIDCDEYKHPIKDGDHVDFGTALYLIGLGKRMQRAGWNDKGMFVFRIQGSNDIARLHGYGFGECLGEPTFQDAIFMRTADNKLVPWTISQSDALAIDWMLAN